MFVKRMFLVLGSVVLGLLLAEVFCRVSPFVDGDTHLFDAPDAHAMSRFRLSETRGYEPVPNGAEDINSLGLRGPDVAVEKAEGVFRILAIGDSVVYGYGVPAKRTFIAQLEHQLKEVHPARKVEALNAGVSGYNTIQELHLLTEVGLAFSPDLVVLGYCPNDVMVTPIVFRDGDNYVFYQPDAGEPGIYNAGLIRASALYRTALVAYNFWSSVRDGSARKNAGTKGTTENDFEGSFRALRDMAALLRERGIPFVCVVFPYLDKPLLEYPQRLREIHARVRSTLKEEGVAVIDLLREWSHEDVGLFRRRNSDDYIHPNAVGHLDVSNRLLAWIQETEVLD